MLLEAPRSQAVASSTHSGVSVHKLCHLVKMLFQGDSSEIRIENSVEYIPVSPYQLPALCPRARPAPPHHCRGNRRVPVLRGSLSAQRGLDPTTAFNEQVLIRVSSPWPGQGRCAPRCRVCVMLKGVRTQSA